MGAKLILYKIYFHISFYMEKTPFYFHIKVDTLEILVVYFVCQRELVSMQYLTAENNILPRV